MGKGDKRASSARAAAALGGAALARAGATFAFGGYSGAQKVEEAATATGSDAGDSALFTAAIDGQLAQHLRGAAKRDPVTKLKSLQAMRGLIKEYPIGSLLPAMPVWVYTFKRLVMDNDRAVRLETMRLQGEIAALLGRQLGPFIKPLMPSWWMAQHDSYREAQAAGVSGFREAFPGTKANEALLFCRLQILEFLAEKLQATPQSLSEAGKETSEEVQDRYERVMYSCLHALGSLLSAACRAPEGGDPKPEGRAKAAEEVQAGATALLSRRGFFKSHLSSKSPIVRVAGYGLLGSACRSCPAALEGGLQEMAPAILGSVGEQDAAAAAVMWEALLLCLKTFPGLWEHVNLQKVFLPKLHSLLRHGGHSTGPVAFQALLPLVSQLPPSAMQPKPAVPIEIISSAWGGANKVVERDVQSAAVASVAEVLIYTLGSAAKWADGQTGPQGDAYARETLEAVVQGILVPEALRGSNAASSAVFQVLASFVKGVGSSGKGTSPAVQVIEAIGAGAAKLLAEAGREGTEDGAEGEFVMQRAAELMQAVHDTCQSQEILLEESKRAVAAPIAAAVLPLVGGTGRPSASSLMAKLVLLFGPEVAGQEAGRGIPETSGGDCPADASEGGNSRGSLSIPGLIETCLAAAATVGFASKEYEANVELLLSLLRRQPRPEAAMPVLLCSLAGLPPPPLDGLRGEEAKPDHIQVMEMLPGLPEAQQAAAADVATCIAAHAASGPQPEMWRSQELDRVALRLSQGHFLGAEVKDTEQHRVGAAQLLSTLMGSGGCAALISDAALAEVLSELANHIECCATWLLDGVGQGGIEEEQAEEDDSRWAAAAAALSALEKSVFCQPPAASWRANGSLIRILTAIFSLSWLVPHDVSASHEPPQGSEEEEEEDGHSTDEEEGSGNGDQCVEAVRRALEAILELRPPPPPPLCRPQERLRGSDDGDYSSWNGSAAICPRALVVRARVPLSASRLWGQGAAAAALCSHLSPHARSGALRAVVGRLRQGMASQLQGLGGELLGTPHAGAAEEHKAWGRIWGRRAHEALLATCSDASPEELQEALDSILAPLLEWPRWASPAHDSPRKPGICPHSSPRLHLPGEEDSGEKAVEGNGVREALRQASADADKVCIRMCAFAAALCQGLGADLVLRGRTGGSKAQEVSSPRCWLAIELLCQWSWSCPSDAAAAFLVVPALAADASENPASPLVAGVLSHCLAGAAGSEAARSEWKMMSSTHLSSRDAHQLVAMTLRPQSPGEASPAPHRQDPYARALRTALAGLVGSSSNTAILSSIESFFDKTVAPSDPSALQGKMQTEMLLSAASEAQHNGLLTPSLLVELLQIVAPTLRIASSSSALQEMGLRWLSATSSLPPPLLVAQRGGGGREAAALARWCSTARVALAALPVRPSDPPPLAAVGPASEEEREALLRMLRTLSSARHRAKAAAATNRRLLGSGGRESGEGGQGKEEEDGGAAVLRQEAAELEANVCLAAAAYAWEEASAEDWGLLTEGATEGLSAAAVEAEDAAEVVADTVAEVTSELAKAELSPIQAVTVLLQLGSLGSLPQEVGARLLRALGEKREGGVQATPLMQQLLLVVRLWPQFGGSLPAPRGWPSQAEEAIGSALRIFFSWGAMEAMASAASHSSSNEPLEAVWRAQEAASGLVAAAAGVAHAIVTAGSGMYIEKAIDAADVWAEDSGSDAANCLLSVALTRSPKPIPAVRHAALLVLHSSKLSKALTSAAGADEGDEDEDEGRGEREDSAFSSLVAAGVRPLLARSICSPMDKEERLLAWLLLLHHMAALPAICYGRRRLAQAIRDAPDLVPALLEMLVPLMDLPPPPTKGKPEPPAVDKPGTDWLQSVLSGQDAPGTYCTPQLASCAFALALRTLPASVRLWFGDLHDNISASAIERYTIRQESPWLLKAEMSIVQEEASSTNLDNFSVKVNSSAREVVAVMELDDDARLEMVVKLPQSFPLRAAEAEIRRKVGVSERRLRKWLMSITVFLRNYNGSIGDAIELWRKNVEKEFEGLEECLICYSVIHPSNRSLPRLSCRTCTKKFHAACLYKWFRSSGKSNCPHCQSPW